MSRASIESKIKLEELEKLGALHCTVEECAAFFEVSLPTMKRYLDPKYKNPLYREVWERGRQRGKQSLRRLQWSHANGTGSSAVTMTIHLSKHWLGETEQSAEQAKEQRSKSTVTIHGGLQEHPTVLSADVE